MKQYCFQGLAERNQSRQGRTSGTSYAAIRGRLGAHQEGGVGSRGQGCSGGLYTRDDCAGSRFSTCLGLNVRDSRKGIDFLAGMTLSLGGEQKVRGRSEWQSQADVVAGRSEGWAAGEHGASYLLLRVRYGERLVVCPAVGQPLPRATCASGQRGAARQVPSRYPPSTRPTRQAFVAPRRHANARFVYLPCRYLRQA